MNNAQLRILRSIRDVLKDNVPALAVLAILTVAFVALYKSAPFYSVEMHFSDRSASGLAIVPASCPSSPDYVGQCDPPSGWLDAVDCNEARGWAYDIGEPTQTIAVHFYIDGTAPGNYAGQTVADIYRPDLCDAIGTCDHGFVWRIPDQYLDGNPHTVYAFGIDPRGVSNPQLSGTPKTLGSFLADTSEDNRGFKVTAGTSNKRISKYGVSACLSNAGNRNYFVPAGSEPEITSFRAAAPSLPGLQINERVDNSTHITYQAETDLSHGTGYAVAGGWTVDNTPGGMSYGPYVTNWGGGRVTATFYVAVSDNSYYAGSSPRGITVGTIDLRDASTGEVIAVRTLYPYEFIAAGSFQPFTLSASLAGRTGHAMETRVISSGQTPMTLDKVEVMLSP